MKVSDNCGIIRVTPGQRKIIHSFEIGGGAEWIAFRINKGRPEDEHLVVNVFKLAFYVLVFDPNDKLRLHYYIVNEDKWAVIHHDWRQSSYGAVGGVLPSGTWCIQIIPEVPCQETYSIAWEQGTGTIPEQYRLPEEERDYWSVVPEGESLLSMSLLEKKLAKEIASKWYRGDLHVHTNLSDGRKTPEETMQTAERCGFDYLMIADHNLMMTSWPKGKPLFMPGTELSTRLGDCNLIGLTEGPDIRGLLTEHGLSDKLGMLEILDKARASGALVSINHPVIEGGYWNFPEFPLNQMDAMEIWNYGSHRSQPKAVESTLRLWNELWNDGRQVTGISGSDHHGEPVFPRSESDPPFIDWNILIFIYAPDLSVDGIVDGIRKRQVYVTRGPYLDVEITAERRKFTIGSNLTEAMNRRSDKPIEVQYVITLDNVAPGAIHWIENGKEVHVQPIDRAGTYRFDFAWKHESYNWLRPEIRSADGALQAFANPIFCGYKRPELTTWQELLDRAGVGDDFMIPYAMYLE